MIKNFDELINRVQNELAPRRVAVAAAHDEHTLEAVNLAFKNGIIEPVLIGDRDKIKELIQTHDFDLKNAEIYEGKDDKVAATQAVNMIRQGEADFIMKGKLQTADLLKEVVNKEHGLQTGSLMSHFGIFEIPNYHKLLALTDGGMIPNPNAEEKIKILENSVKTLHALGYENPKVAVLAAAEIVNPKIQASIDAGLLKEMNQKGEISGCTVEGPISYDLMISTEAAESKGYKSAVTGDADILITPDMTSGNLLAKSLQFSANAKMAGIIVGAKVPIVLVSRGASSEEKYLSMLLSAAVV